MITQPTVLVLAAFIGGDVSVPRIVVRDGRFVEQDSGRPFVPKGFNYVRLRPKTPGRIRHATFDPTYYDREAIERMFADLGGHGFNAVRVFVDTSTGPGGIVESPEARTLSDVFMGNVFDFLERGRRHGVRVLFVFSMWVPKSDWLARRGPAVPGVTGPNVLYFDPTYVRSRAFLAGEFARVIRTRKPTLAPVVFAYELQNELCFFTHGKPLSLTHGTFTFLGKDYDLSSERALQDLMDRSAVHWVDSGVAAVRKADPDAMVTISVFTFRAVGRSGPGALRSDRTRDQRVPARPLALVDSTASYVDVHLYVGPNVEGDLAAHLASVEFDAFKKRSVELGKPILMGEFGAIKSRRFFPEKAAVADKMRLHVQLARKLGFAGFLYWTYDAMTEQTSLWHAKDGEGEIFQALVNAWP